MTLEGMMPRLATPDDAAEVGRLLDAFNIEFEAATPGPEVLAGRLGVLLSVDTTFAVVAGDPAVAVGLVTLRPNVWHDGPVGLLDELYVSSSLRGNGIGSEVIAAIEGIARSRGVEIMEINVDVGDLGARRFYERHGYTAVDPDTAERALYYYRALG